MMHDWEDGLIGNNLGTIWGLAKRETLAQVLVRSVRPVLAERVRERLRRAA